MNYQEALKTRIFRAESALLNCLKDIIRWLLNNGWSATRILNLVKKQIDSLKEGEG